MIVVFDVVFLRHSHFLPLSSSGFMIHSILLLLKCLFSVLYYTLEDSFKKHKWHSCYKILMQL